MKLIKINPQKSKAQAMVEFAIALPILLMLVYGLLETGRLLFTYSSVTNATRQAVRYGSTTGVGSDGVTKRYLDCTGIKAAAQASDFLNVFNDSDIEIWYDGGPNTGTKPGVGLCGAVTSLSGNNNRVVVRITSHFVALVPKLVPFVTRDITGTSARTVVLSIAIQGGGTGNQPTPTYTETATKTFTPTQTFTPSRTPTRTLSPTVTRTNTAGPSPTNTKTFTPTPTAAATSCAITYVVNQWDTGFTANITITNNGGSAINGYTLSWVFTAGQQVASGWNATYSQSGSIVEASNPAGNWNGTIAGNGGTVSFGFNGTHTGTNPTPASFVLNGLPCSGGSPLPTATPTPSQTPSPIPTGVNCSLVTHGAISYSGSTMNMVINNNTGSILSVSDILLTWNHDTGRNGNRALSLTNGTLVSSFWSGTNAGPTISITPTSLTIPTGASTIIFTFNFTYTNKDNTERIIINLSTPGCTSIDSNT